MDIRQYLRWGFPLEGPVPQAALCGDRVTLHWIRRLTGFDDRGRPDYGASIRPEIAQIAQGAGRFAAAVVDVFDGTGGAIGHAGSVELIVQGFKTRLGHKVGFGRNGAIGQQGFRCRFRTFFLGERNAQSGALLWGYAMNRPHRSCGV